MIVVRPKAARPSPFPGFVRSSATFRFGRWPWSSQELWYDVPGPSESLAPESATPWAIIALPYACLTGQDLLVEGSVDAHWLQNAPALMDFWAQHQPRFRAVQLRTTGEQRLKNPPSRQALFFTGGVDSFYSLVLSEAQKIGVQDLIYVCGYDIPLASTAVLERKVARLRAIASQAGKNLIIIKTNLRETRLRKVPWGPVMHGPALATAALCVSPGWDRVLISGSYGPQNLQPWGSHPVTDPLLGTIYTQFVHYGKEVDRFEKTEFLSNSDLALRHLHVCWQQADDTNCGVCEKCLRTQLALAILGAGDRCSAFPPGSFSLDRLRSLPVGPELSARVYPSLRRHALQRGRQDLASAIDECLQRNAASRPQP